MNLEEFGANKKWKFMCNWYWFIAAEYWYDCSGLIKIIKRAIGGRSQVSRVKFNI